MSTLFQDAFAKGDVMQAKPQEHVFRVGDQVRFVYFVEQGSVDLVRHLKTGARMVLHRAGKGQILAEASVYSAHYHCDGVVQEEAVLRRLPLPAFRHKLETESALSDAWAAHLARVLQKTRMYAEIRTLRTVEDRLDAWLGEGNEVPQKGRWLELAQTLGVSREALYRELAKRR